MKNLTVKLQEQFNAMCATGKLFRVNRSGQELWDLYLASFKDDPTFRDPESSEHNCNHCNNFIRRYGNVVSVSSDMKITSIFDVDTSDEYTDSMNALKMFVESSQIKEVFFETFNILKKLPYESCSKTNSVFKLGTSHNHKRYTKEEAEKFGVVKVNETKTFHHLHLSLPNQFVDMTGKSIESIMSDYRSSKEVFKRAMDEISIDTLYLVKDLINQGSLLDGDAHLHKINTFIPFKLEYNKLSSTEKDNWSWVTSYKLSIAKFKNSLIGVLCSELSEGEELNKACRSWNKRVDPANYMKAKSPITQRQIKEAQKFVEDNGYVESFDRRFATMDDIKVSEIKHSNVGDGSIKSVSLFDKVKSTKTRHKRNEFRDVEEVSVEKFMKDILPSCSSVEAFLENRHEGNMVSLTTSNQEESKSIMKWSNNYSWTYNGNLAGKSQLSDMVEAKGGRTDGVFRFTHSWNEIEPNASLMDLHVLMPNCSIPNSTHQGHFSLRGSRVGWNNRRDFASEGSQDVDYTIAAPDGYIPVENITFPDINKMPEGTYTCMVHNWGFRKTGGKGRAEIAFGGKVYNYIYPSTKHGEWVKIAEVTLLNGEFSIKHFIEEANESKELYGLETNQFHKVNLVCLSPNHWNGESVGNKHFMFMLDKCKTDSDIRSFHIENIIPELRDHRKVLEVLGTTNMLESMDGQLSGLGFNATVRDSVILKLSGNFKRVIKVKF